MTVIALFFLLQAICLAAGFGLSYSFLKNTAYPQLSVLIAPILLPISLVLLMTSGGYRVPQDVPPVLPALLAAPLVIFTATVIYRHRSVIASNRKTFAAGLGILGASTALGLASLAPDIANHGLTYVAGLQLNAELLNYAALASHLLGRTLHAAYAAAYQDAAATRSGADLLLASLAGTLNAPPANCASLAVALLRSHAIAAFGFLLLRATNLGLLKRPLLMYSGIAAFALSSVELINYSISFLSQYSVAPVAILLVAFLQFKEDIYDVGIIVLMSLLYLYVYISYFELLPILIFIQVAQAALIGLRAHSARLAALAISPPIAAAVVNPILVAKRIHYLTALSSVQAGFVVLAAPSQGLGDYLATILSLRFPFFSLRLIDDRRAETAIAFFLLLSLVLAFAAAFRMRGPSWLFPAALLFIAATVMGLLSDPGRDGPATVYKANKVIIYENFLLVAAFVLAVYGQYLRGPIRRLLVLGYGVFVTASCVLSLNVVSRFASWPKAYSLNDVSSIAGNVRANPPVVLPFGDEISSMYWNGVLQFYGVSDRLGAAGLNSGSPLLDARTGAGDIKPVGVLMDKKAMVLFDPLTIRFDSNGREMDGQTGTAPAGKVLYRDGSFALYFGSAPQPVAEFSASVRIRPAALEGAMTGFWPLLTTGEQNRGAVIYAALAAPGRYRIELDVWGMAHKTGMEFPIPHDANAFDMIRINGRGVDGSYTVTVTVNGNPALSYEGVFSGVTETTLFWGEDRISFPKVAPSCPACRVEDVSVNGKPSHAAQ